MFDFTRFFSILFAHQNLVFLLDFNKLHCEDNCLSFSFPKTLVRAALSAFLITLLFSKGKGNRVDVHQISFIIIHTSEFCVLLGFNILRCEDISVSFSFPKTLVSAAL